MEKLEGSVRWVVWGAIGLGFVLAIPSAHAQSPQACLGPGVFIETLGPAFPMGAPGCFTGADVCECFGFFDDTFCAKPKVLSQSAGLTDPLCDPTDETGSGCSVLISVTFEQPGNEETIVSWAPDPAPTPHVFLFNVSEPPECTFSTCMGVADCGSFVTGRIESNTYEIQQTLSGVKCSNVMSVQRSMRAIACPLTCEKRTSVSNLGGTNMAAGIGCPIPPKDECDDCKSCPIGDSGTSVGGGGPTFSPGRSGPGALLRYRAGGAGAPGLPGSTGWTPTLGLFWSHNYAQRIVMDPDETHVWLLTEFGSFREFSGLSGGVYGTVSPSDEYRTLTRTATGWELSGLDGSVVVFEEVSGQGFGRWVSETDRNGNAKTATYDVISGDLDEVAFADGRKETFGYAAPGGKLTSIAEVGIDGTTTRTWSYTWTGDELTRIDRPDGTAWELFYADPSFPGYLTRQELVGSDGTSRRVKRAWEYDAQGNVAKTWKGDASFTGPDAVEKWQLSYDNAVTPTVTTVTGPLGGVSTYAVGRDPGNGGSTKPRVTEISGDCPTCGLGPNSVFEYDDASNPMLPTAVTDGRGHRTERTYDSDGRVLTRIEAVLEPEERTTTFTYDPTFPALVTSVEVESTSGAPAVRRTETTIDPVTGDATLRRLIGVESGSLFQYDTATVYNTEGQPTSLDPPGYGATDVTSFTYDPLRGNLLPLTRTDPLVGATSFGYDAFNRRTLVTDPNAVATETEYDALDRVTRTIRKGATSPEDLVTENVYSVFGDLERTVLPEGNVIVYGYDSAGRLETISRGPLATDLRERTKYTLDGFGNRVTEELQRFDTGGGVWQTESETDYVYTTRCRLDQIVRAPGTPEESVTEYAYDCSGNLEKVWDANHDSAVDPPTQAYAYDALDRLTSITQPWSGTGGGNAVTTYGYDVQDHLTSVTDAEGNQTTYVYSDRDLLTRQVSPVSGQTDFTYNEHGELSTEIDARSVVVTRTVDELDRVTQIDYTDATLDTTFVYDSGSFGVGRLSSITRNGGSVAYAYDRFGRVTQDGDLNFTYDENGNRATVGYPGGITATYTYDYADRPETLMVDDGVNPSQTVVSSASYKPSGPLESLALGNGLTETRGFDGRYFPASIDLTGGLQRTWSYTTDKVGNILQIDETVGCPLTLAVDNQTLSAPEVFEACDEVSSQNTTVQSPGAVVYRAGDRVVLEDDFRVETGAEFTAVLDPRIGDMTSFSYQYQDHHYFLTQGTGPWGTLDYTYDKIGNRLTETRAGGTDTYGYTAGASGNTPLLDSIALGVGGTRDYTYGPAGHLEEVASGANVIDFTPDEAGRLRGLDRLGNTVTNTYDGRSFLEKVEKPLGGGDFRTTEPVYSSEGLLHALTRKANAAATPEQVSYFAFSGRPVAQLEQVGATSTWTFLTADHLGTPFVATDLSGDETWLGPFEPFGRDTLAGSAFGATESGIYLRFPGQWDDGTWAEASSGAELSYNVHRWYERGTGRYGRVDPLAGDIADRARFLGLVPYHSFAYVDSNPLIRLDPFGLEVLLCERPNQIPEFEGIPVLGGLPHMWFKTPNNEAGLGPAQGGVPGDELPACRCQQTAVTDHTGQSELPGSSCKLVRNVDQDCVDRLIKPGQQHGPWVPLFNDCWSFALRVIKECRIDEPQAKETQTGLPSRRY